MVKVGMFLVLVQLSLKVSVVCLRLICWGVCYFCLNFGNLVWGSSLKIFLLLLLIVVMMIFCLWVRVSLLRLCWQVRLLSSVVMLLCMVVMLMVVEILLLILLVLWLLKNWKVCLLVFEWLLSWWIVSELLIKSGVVFGSLVSRVVICVVEWLLFEVVFLLVKVVIQLFGVGFCVWVSRVWQVISGLVCSRCEILCEGLVYWGQGLINM